MSKVLPTKSNNQDYNNEEEGDSESCASSSLNSENNEPPPDTSEKSIKSSFVLSRNAIKNKVLKEVMEQVMPDIGAYDIDGMMRSKSVQKSGYIVRLLKSMGKRHIRKNLCYNSYTILI